MSVLVECPTCGASIEIGETSWVPHDEGFCKLLAGTKYLDHAKCPDPGIHWCPDLSDAASAYGVVLLHRNYRPQVLAEIEQVKAARDKEKSSQ
jgi:hypothetical protein